MCQVEGCQSSAPTVQYNDMDVCLDCLAKLMEKDGWRKEQKWQTKCDVNWVPKEGEAACVSCSA